MPLVASPQAKSRNGLLAMIVSSRSFGPDPWTRTKAGKGWFRPTGSVSVVCQPNTPYWTNGKVDLTLTEGQEATCTVPVVKNNPVAPYVPLGAVIDPNTMPGMTPL